jgi:hypothetical protein
MEFTNSKYIFNYCGEKNKCMVPLACLVRYKGILAFAKAMLL